MIHEAVETVEAIIWGAVVSFSIMAALAAYLIVALGYWAAVFALWAGRRLTAWARYRRNLPNIRAAIDAEAQRADTEWARKRAIARAHATPPRITTRPGTDQQALHTCTAIWNTSPREEKP